VFQTPGGNAPVVYCKAADVAPDVRIYKKSGVNRPGLGRSGDPSKEVNSVQFGDVEVGKVSTKVLIVQNNTGLPVSFAFQAEDKGLFGFSQVSGVASPRLETAVKVTFTPEYAGNFYRRVYCLLENGPFALVVFLAALRFVLFLWFLLFVGLFVCCCCCCCGGGGGGGGGGCCDCDCVFEGKQVGACVRACRCVPQQQPWH
jgi:hypothetical protein